MQNNLSGLLDEAIALELNVSEVYMFYFHTFDKDKDFWWQLAIEEKRHAALLRAAKENFLKIVKLPREIVESNLDDLIKGNRKITELLESYQKETPSMEEAYRAAFELEKSAGELHYNKLMTEDSDSRIIEIFQKLNGEDKGHAIRIQKFMKRRGIALS